MTKNGQTALPFFFKKQYNFDLPLGSFQCAKFTKNTYTRLRVVTTHFYTQNGALVPNKIQDTFFMCFFSPFILQKMFFFKKKVGSRVMKKPLIQFFMYQNDPLPRRIFFEKINDVIFMYLLAPFIAQNS